MRRTLPSLLLAFAACGPAIGLDDGDSSGNSTEGPGTTSDSGPPVVSTTSASPSTSGPPATTTTADESTDEGVNFIEPTGGTCLEEAPDGTLFHCPYCDIFAQDCAPGDKCMPWANDGGSSWNATRCSPVSDMPGQVGESCSVEGSNVSGIDTCDLGLMCWDVDPQTLTGVCEAMCTGSPEDPQCQAGYSCAISGDGVLALCLSDCDPIAMDCPGNDQCAPMNDGFACAPAGDEAPPGEPCTLVNECVDGAVCISPDLTPDCAGASGCCSSFCDLMAPDPMAGCLPGQTCLPWYEPGNAPPEYAHVGACGVEPA
jgi:hypothetical protein